MKRDIDVTLSRIALLHCSLQTPDQVISSASRMFVASPSSETESDFPRSPFALPASFAWSSASRAKLQVGLVAASTVSVGFVEACLHFDRRPVPLRFAVKYALSNALPSAVWKTVSAEYVAAACNVPSSTLITSPASSGMSVRARAKRMILLQSLRSVRYVVGSYGVAWSLWRLYSASAESGGHGADDARVFFERVIRLAPEDSALSKVSKKKHGDHITTLPLISDVSGTSERRSALAIDWPSLGLLTAQCPRESGENPVSPHILEANTIKLMEVELQDANAAKSARRAIKRAIMSGASSLFSILHACGSLLISL